MKTGMLTLRNGLALAALVVLLAGCFTAGREFTYTAVPQIKPGETTQEQVHQIFGNPVRVGTEDGLPVWTYMRYRVSLFSGVEGRDLVIKFDANNVVKTYSYSTMTPGEGAK